MSRGGKGGQERRTGEEEAEGTKRVQIGSLAFFGKTDENHKNQMCQFNESANKTQNRKPCSQPLPAPPNHIFDLWDDCKRKKKGKGREGRRGEGRGQGRGGGGEGAGGASPSTPPNWLFGLLGTSWSNPKIKFVICFFGLFAP